MTIIDSIRQAGATRMVPQSFPNGSAYAMEEPVAGAFQLADGRWVSVGRYLPGEANLGSFRFVVADRPLADNRGVFSVSYDELINLDLSGFPARRGVGDGVEIGAHFCSRDQMYA